MRQRIIAAMRQRFLDSVKSDEANGIDYFWKWAGTRQIAREMRETDLTPIRKELKKMEAEGIVVADRTYNNWTRWSLVSMPGFEPHRFSGYVQRKKGAGIDLSDKPFPGIIDVAS